MFIKTTLWSLNVADLLTPVIFAYMLAVGCQELKKQISTVLSSPPLVLLCSLCCLSSGHIWIEDRNVKVLPDNIVELLTPVVFAFWISSDGSFHKRDGETLILTES